MTLKNNCLEWSLKLLSSILIILMIPGLASAATITVGTGEIIQAAVDRANPGDIIEVESGTYKESIDVNKQLTLIGIDTGQGAPIIGSAYINANRCKLTGFYIEDTSGFGISVLSNNNNITDNKIVACTGGIFLKNCNGNLIAHNDARVLCQGLMGFLRGDGIHLLNSDDNIIKDNVVENGFIGIFMDSSSHNLVEDNYASNNTNGIGLLTSLGNTIKNNTIRYSSDDGLGILKFSNDSVIEGNTIEKSGDYGINLQDSSHNAIYLNNFVGNKKNAGSRDARSKGSSNQWYSPEPINYSWRNKGITSYLGNFWSDYRGTDSDGNGIGNDPYEFNGGQDDHPLMKRFSDFTKA
jgi:parallel beta-helix repeat protein